MKNIKTIVTTVLIISFALGVGGGVVGTLVVNTLTNATRSVVSNENTKGEVLNIETSTVDAVSKVLPSVVSISIFQDVRLYSNKTGPNPFGLDGDFEFPFDFKLAPPDATSDESTQIERQEVGGGSGFIVSPNGLIITNKHVVNNDEAILKVILQDGTEYDAEVLGVDPFNDLAVLKIDADNLPAVTLGDSDAINIGQSVIAIGNSLGEYQNTVTKGIISGIHRRISAGDRGFTEVIEEAIQTDAAINPGNSGGPLINLDGEVIGVNTAISLSGQLIGFAIPINTAKNVIESVIEFGRIVRPWLGVRYIINSESYATENSIERNDGAVIVEGDDGTSGVLSESPAEKAGIKTGDIIISVDGIEIRNTKPLGKVIASHKPGDTVTLVVFRDGDLLNINVVLEEFKN